MTGTAIEKAEKFEFDTAEEIFRALAEIDVQEEKTILNLAYLYEQRMDLYIHQDNHGPVKEAVEEARLTYLKALERHPESPDVLFGAGYFFLMTGSSALAGEYLSAFLKYSGNDDKRKDKVKKAVREIKRRSGLDSLFTSAYEAIRKGNEQEGIEKIGRFLTENPGTWSAWFLLGWAHRRMGSYGKAKDAFASALELETTEADIYNEMAICLLELEEYEECRSMLDKALSIEPDNTKILSNRFILALKTDKTTEARELLQIILEIDPDDPIAVRYRDILNDM
jgi:Flp pilus assembly protein TadD